MALTAQQLDSQLDAAAREFIDDDRNVYVDREQRETRLSAIFAIYIKEFLGRLPGPAAYVNGYGTEQLRLGYKIVFRDYDWRSEIRRVFADTSKSDPSVVCRA